ncbi:MAG: exosortase-associated EpsI family protein [Gemmataceae bacterium]
MTARPYLPTVAFLVAVAGAGVAHGLYTDRWGQSPDRAAAAAKLADIPRTIGPWVGEDRPMDPAEVAAAGVDGYVHRVYRNPATRQAVTLFVVCGRPGPVSVHTPDVCYQASGFMLAGSPAREPVGPAEVWSAVMAKPSAAVPEALAVRWAWRTPTAGWQAPDRPRVSFARSGVLYKAYVLTDRTARTDPAPDFMALALPALDRVLAD